VLAETTELYQPQELNYLPLNAISYNKGCYTGQEIIARLYFRGKLKQWTHRFTVKLSELPALNTVIYDATGHSQGHVVLAAQTDAQTVELLAIVRHDHCQQVFLGEEKEPLQLLDLPYVVEVKE
ncbi:MAG TPA: tRNA-modifying protein YgfZ, partial [Agitococcus sp.]|nr:tRNA-modifying protein YgfZ [Agitococcus sp.]